MKPRLSKAQWELLRKLPDSRDGHAVCRLAGGEINTARSLAGRGLARMSGQIDAWRTPAGRDLLAAEDQRMEATRDDARRDFVASIMGTREDEVAHAEEKVVGERLKMAVERRRADLAEIE